MKLWVRVDDGPAGRQSSGIWVYTPGGQTTLPLVSSGMPGLFSCAGTDETGTRPIRTAITNIFKASFFIFMRKYRIFFVAL
jgi:hypothetical protein